MKSREYIAYWNDGHDNGKFTFYSEHRANSKANLEDARNAMRRKYGWRTAQYQKITFTERCEDIFM